MHCLVQKVQKHLSVFRHINFVRLCAEISDFCRASRVSYTIVFVTVTLLSSWRTLRKRPFGSLSKFKKTISELIKTFGQNLGWIRTGGFAEFGFLAKNCNSRLHFATFVDVHSVFEVLTLNYKATNQ